MNKTVTVSALALAASLFASGCEYHQAGLEGIKQAEATQETTQSEGLPDTGTETETLPEGPVVAQPATGGEDHQTPDRNPYLHCEDYETMTGCYWVDPAPGGRPPRPMVPAEAVDAVSETEPSPPSGCVEDPATGLILCYPPPPPPQEDPAVVQPANGFSTSRG